MKEHPILFQGDMVRAILDGRKTQTRRIVKLPRHNVSGVYWDNNPDDGHSGWFAADIDSGQFDAAECWNETRLKCPYGERGDALWVRENWAQRRDLDAYNGTQLYTKGIREAWYWADGPGRCCNTGCNGAAGRVRAARFMPRWASRITLEVVNVRVERVQDITEADARAEGIDLYRPKRWDVEFIRNVRADLHCSLAVGKFAQLWDSINANRGFSWADNPFVWVVEFERMAQS